MDENIDFLNGLALQKFPPLNEDEFLPVIKIRELKQGFTTASGKASTEIPEKYVICNGDILFSWSGSLEIVLWCDGKGALNQHLFKVSSNVYPKWFYFFWVREYLPLYKSIAEGKATTMGHIQRRHLTDTIINVPNKELMNLADSILSPILEKIQENKIQIQSLTQIRDTLLPKLMSGVLEVKSGE
jgi:type I restriction enzyme S subunit